jgi:hypothetical protein
VIASGSHAGRYAAAVVLAAGVRAALLNDAGIGLRRAGVAGLEVLQDADLPAVAVDHDTARIGHASDTLDGVLSASNGAARALGCELGMPARQAAQLLCGAERATAARVAVPVTARSLIDAAHPAIWACDSASLVRDDDVGSILMLGSHGGLVGGSAARALRTDALAAVFNDAGGSAGTTRLPALDRRGIAAATVSAHSAAIGDGLSTYHEGVLSAVNQTAAEMGAEVGMTARAFADLIRNHGGTRDVNER